MALTAVARYGNRVGESLTGMNSYVVKNLSKIYHGALVGAEPGQGMLQNWTSASAVLLRFLGLAMPKTDSVTGVVLGVNPQIECPVNESGVILEDITVAGSTQDDVGDPVYATDENTFSMTPTSNVGAVGRLVRFTTAGKGDVQLFTPAQYLALESLGKV
jgi:hypothetical protein